MKPAPFDYARADSLAEALAILDGEAEVTVLAGGQSLVPMLNFRLARPEMLLDINGIRELAQTAVDGGMLRIGALVRLSEIERSTVIARGWPLLHSAVAFVAHRAIRNRGTVGGSVAHADPRAEIPAALLALDARVRCRSSAGERVVPIADFIRGPLHTMLARGELVESIEVPATAPRASSAFLERAVTHGAYATAAAGVIVDDERSAIALIGAAPVAIRAVDAERALNSGATACEVATLAGALATDGHRAALLADLVRGAIEQARS